MRKTPQPAIALQENLYIDTSTPSAMVLFGKNWMPNNNASVKANQGRSKPTSPTSFSNGTDFLSG